MSETVDDPVRELSVETAKARDDNEVGIRETWLDALQECFHSFSPVTGQTRVEFRPAFR